MSPTVLTPLQRPAFRRLWLSQVASETGDWAGRLALAALVWAGTGSALWSTLVFVGGLLPQLGPGQLLATYADRLGRRAVMVVADLARAGVFALLAVAGDLPPAVVLALSVLAGLATAPFEAARGAAVVELAQADPDGDDDGVAAAVSLTHATQDVAVLLGYVAGGWLLAVTDARIALAANAVTFLVSAALLSRLPRTTGTTDDDEPAAPPLRTLAAAARRLAGDRLSRRFVVLGTTAVAAGSALDGLAVPLFAGTGRTWLAGPVLALVAVVSLVLTLALGTARDPRTLLRLTGWATLAPAAVGAAGLLTGVLAAQVAAFAATGGLYVTLVAAGIVVGPRLPASLRATSFALLGGLLTAAQVLHTGVAGVLA